MQKITSFDLSRYFLLAAFFMSLASISWSQTTTTYNDNGNIYSVVVFTNPSSSSWTVPVNVSSVTIKVWGGGGGQGGQDCGAGCTNAPGGPVGYIEATYAVTQGDEFSVHPGGKGGNGANSVAATGGGAGGISPFSINYNGGQGGHAASQGTSGGGGGGGAATIVALNASVVAVTGGAGGGGGMANMANSGKPGSSVTLANGTSNTGGVGASGSSCGKSDGGGAGGGGGGQYGSVGGTAYVASDTECAGNGGYRGNNVVIGSTSTVSNSFVSWSNNGKVEIIYTPKDIYLNADATDANSYSGSGNTWTDLTIHNNDLNLVGSPAFNTTFGGYFEFDGSGSQYAEANGFYGSGVFVGSSAAPENWNGNSTYEAWVNPASLNTTTARLVFGDGNNNEGLIDFRSDRIRAWNSAGIVAEYVASIAADQWYHVAMTHERTGGNNYEIKLFVDGVEVASTTGTTTDMNYGPDNHLRIGYNWDGAIARSKVYNYIRTEVEITDSYDANKTLYCHFEYTATAPSGSGTEVDPYLVSNFENLLWISHDNTRWNQHYLQTADINASATAEECFNYGLGWSPIGDALVEFTGSYNGGGYTIANLTIDRPSQQHIGLFGVISGATIENLFLNGTTVANWDAGGLVGLTIGATSLINNVHTNVDLTVESTGGGIAGHHQGTIENSSALGNVTGNNSNFGGLVGYNNGGKIYRSFASGNISNNHADNGQVGGLVGALLAGSVLEDCYAIGNISSIGNSISGGVGGLVGRIRVADPAIVRCYSTGTPTAIGGPVGGLVGYNADGGGTNVSNSFWDTETSGTSSSVGGTGLTTANMKTLSNYLSAGWDAQCELINGTDDYWGKNSLDNNGYLFLSWQGYAHESTVDAGIASEDQSVCLGGAFQSLALTGSNGTIQWQMSNDFVLFADIDGATTTALDLQAIGITEDTWFRAVISDGSCTDTSNVVAVEVIQPITSNITVTACNSYLAPDGQEYGESGEYVAIIPSAAGCDSTITIDLTVNADIDVYISAEACGSYIAPDDSVYSASGQYLAVLQRENGCDSLITINLTIHEATSSIIEVASCNSYVAPDGQQYIDSGQYQAIVTNAAGCDSTITINLTITESTLDLSYTTQAATPGFANGSALVTASGGTSPYTYQWNDPFMQTTATLSGVFAGTYECIVTDAAGCSMTLVVFVDLFTGVPTTEVHANYCNTGGYALGDLVSAQFVPNAEAFRWEFVEQGGSPLPEYTRNQGNPHILLHWISGISLGTIYEVRVKVRINGVWGEYGAMCTVAIATDVPLTEVRASYTPTNGNGELYAMCNITTAYTVNNATNYEWEFDNGIDGPITYQRGSGNPSIKLSWVNCLQPNASYQVRVRAEVDGQWGSFGNALPLNFGPTAPTQLRSNLCNETWPLNKWLLPTGVCISDSHEWVLVNTITSEVHSIVTNNPTGAARLSWAVPALVPNATYSVRVKATQCGEEGEFNAACSITIAGPQAQSDIMPALRTLSENSTTLYPNPNAGKEVRIGLDGMGDGHHEIMIQIYDVFGKLIQTEGFGHTGSTMSRLVGFDENLAMGIYLVQIIVDGERFATERLLIQ